MTDIISSGLDDLQPDPPADTLKRPDGPHSNNPHVRDAVLTNKQPQHLMWVYERPDGGRGFGFTGGHSHRFWGNENFLKPVLNAILWIAKAEVPAEGVPCAITAEELTKNLDDKGKPKPKPAAPRGRPVARASIAAGPREHQPITSWLRPSSLLSFPLFCRLFWLPSCRPWRRCRPWDGTGWGCPWPG